jgi:hypothetical protein
VSGAFSLFALMPARERCDREYEEGTRHLRRIDAVAHAGTDSMVIAR